MQPATPAKDEMMKIGVSKTCRMLGAAEQIAQIQDAQGVACTRVVRPIGADERGAMREQPCRRLVWLSLEIARGVTRTRFSRSTDSAHLSFGAGEKKPPRRLPGGLPHPQFSDCYTDLLGSSSS